VIAYITSLVDWLAKIPLGFRLLDLQWFN